MTTSFEPLVNLYFILSTATNKEQQKNSVNSLLIFVYIFILHVEFFFKNVAFPFFKRRILQPIHAYIFRTFQHLNIDKSEIDFKISKNKNKTQWDPIVVAKLYILSRVIWYPRWLSDTLIGYLITSSQFGEACLIYTPSVGSDDVNCCIFFDIWCVI
jgi:hypothetical protein